MMKKKLSNRIPLDGSEKAIISISEIVLTLFALIAILPCLHLF